jgi:hypothetical protein
MQWQGVLRTHLDDRRETLDEKLRCCTKLLLQVPSKLPHKAKVPTADFPYLRHPTNSFFFVGRNIHASIE